MDVIFGVISIVVTISVSFVLRKFILSSVYRNDKVLYKDLTVQNYDGLYSGAMVYIVSIATAVIGPFSFRLYPMNNFLYILMNAIAGIFFVALYPPFSAVTIFSNLTVLERNGKKFCIVGKIMNRKFRVDAVNEQPKFEVLAEYRGRRCVFQVTSKKSSRK